MNNDHQDARMILALAAEADDEFIWGQIRTLQPEMFAAGPVQIKFAYFGREGTLQTRPCITTNWVADADDMADIMDRGRLAACAAAISKSATSSTMPFRRRDKGLSRLS